MSTNHPTPLTIPSPTLPPNSLVLVTGANGLIATHATDALLSAGYRVRGTVRSLARTTYLLPLFTARHGPDRFTLTEIPDVSVPGAWDAALEGVVAIAHVVGAVDLYVQDADAAAQEEVRWQVGMLEAAEREGGVKSVVFTSSAWAAWTPDAKRRVRLTGGNWNDEAVGVARDEGVGGKEKGMAGKEKGMAGFMAYKTLVEKGVWEWVRERKPGFVFNALLLDTVIGECLDPVNQGIPSTAGMVHWVWENVHVEVLDMMQPQWFVDCRDAGRLYVALLATAPVVDRERVFAFGGRYSFSRVAEILKELYPEHADKMAKLKDQGWDQTEVPNERGAELLARLGQAEGWRSLEESVKENAESWLKLERAGVTDHKHSQFAK